MIDPRKFGGYMKYFEEMERLEQYPGLNSKWRARPLETDSKATQSQQSKSPHRPSVLRRKDTKK